MNHPFPVPSHVQPALAEVHAHWLGLRRGGATIPFWDDFKATDLPGLAGNLFLIDVFKKPERFRVDSMPKAIGAPDLEGRFLDEVSSGWPLQFLRSQCVASLEGNGPTFFRHGADDSGASYSRLILPMWGDGRVGMLLGAIHFG